MTKTLQEIEEREVLDLERENLARICKELRFENVIVENLRGYNVDEEIINRY